MSSSDKSAYQIAREAPQIIEAYVEDQANRIAALTKALEKSDGRLNWVLDQVSPSMFHDHGIAALRDLATVVRMSPPGKQRETACAVIDSYRNKALGLDLADGEPSQSITDTQRIDFIESYVVEGGKLGRVTTFSAKDAEVSFRDCVDAKMRGLDLAGREKT